MDEGDEVKCIADPVHKIIEVHPLCQKVIDTFEFQRLRDITQCGISHLVYPAADHSRFEHSLGVYHLAGKFINELNKRLDVKINEKDALCIQMAALCHDLGHGPFSHSWENFVFLASKEKWKHEDNSIAILKYLIRKNNLGSDFSKFGLEDADVDFIGGLIKGDASRYPNKRKFLFEIVANERTKLDVDKLDYMMRDAFYFNIPCIVDHERILKGVVVKDNSILFRDKVAENILEVFDFRKTMHKRCYQHRVTKILDTMLMEVLLEADEHYFKCFNPEAEGLTLATAHTNPTVFVHLTNYIYFAIMHSKQPELKKSRQIIDNILKRKFFTLIGSLQREEALKKEDIDKLIRKLTTEFENKSYKFKTSIIEASIGTTKDPLTDIGLVNKRGEKITISGKGDRLERYQNLLVFCTESLDKSDPDFKKMESICGDYLKQFVPIRAV